MKITYQKRLQNTGGNARDRNTKRMCERCDSGVEAARVKDVQIK